MKRQHYQFQQKQQQAPAQAEAQAQAQAQAQSHGGGGNPGPSSAMSKGKEPLYYCKDTVGGVDQELASMGYSVKSSDLLQVAQRLEQLEMVMCSAQEDGISHLSSEAIHYNPSDLAGWIESMLTELNAPPDHQILNLPPDQSSTVREASNSLPESSTSTIGRSEPKLENFDSGSGLYDIVGLEGAEYFQDYMDQMVGLLSQPSDTSLLIEPSGCSAVIPHNQTQTPSSREEAELSPPSTLLIPSSSNSSLEVQSRDRHQHHQNQQDDVDVTGGSNREKKRFRVDPTPNGYNIVPDSRSMVMAAADPQESGVRLVHMLMACAQEVQENHLALAGEMVKNIRIMASNQGGAMGKVATYFAEALARRVYGFLVQDALRNLNDPLSDVLEFHFYETCPYLKFAHFTANQAILEAFAGHKRVHVIDFNLKQGMQWPALLQALALRPGGPPAFRLTGIGPPQPDGTNGLQEVGAKLKQLAESINVEFEFSCYVPSNLSDLKLWLLKTTTAPGVEALAVNSILQLHRFIEEDRDSNRRRSSAIDEVLSMVRSLNPKIVTVVEQEADHNRPVFVERFTEALHYYSTVFDSLEACRLPPQSEDQLMSEIYLGREICDIVACEGRERVERHEPLMQWRLRMYNAGFRAVHLGSNAFKQVSMLVTLFSGGEGYRVEENNGCLTLGWHSRPLIAVSAWQCA